MSTSSQPRKSVSLRVVGRYFSKSAMLIDDLTIDDLIYLQI